MGAEAWRFLNLGAKALTISSSIFQELGAEALHFRHQKPVKAIKPIKPMKPIKPVKSRFTNIPQQVHYVVLPPCCYWSHLTGTLLLPNWLPFSLVSGVRSRNFANRFGIYSGALILWILLDMGPLAQQTLNLSV